MVFLRRVAVVAAACVLVGACSGSSFNGISGGDDGGTGDGASGSGGEGGGADARPDGTGSGSGSGSGSGGVDASSKDAKGDVAPDVTGGEAAVDAPSDGVVTPDALPDAPPPCPIVGGAYAITLTQAQGCQDLNPLAPQCIVQNACDIQFQSSTSGGTKPAINGDPTLQQDGSFTGGALKEGTVNRTGCTGTWDATLSTMTVDCGGTGSSQACVAALKRVADKCP
jgi:hypothetical protein